MYGTVRRVLSGLLLSSVGGICGSDSQLYGDKCIFFTFSGVLRLLSPSFLPSFLFFFFLSSCYFLLFTLLCSFPSVPSCELGLQFQTALFHCCTAVELSAVPAGCLDARF